MPSTVLFCPADGVHSDEWPSKLEVLLHRLGLPKMSRKGDLIGIKVHVGEGEKSSYLGPELAAGAARGITALGGKPFFTDTCVLYRSPRADAVSHTRLAAEHGYSLESAGAPFLVADGLTGAFQEEVAIPVDGGKRLMVAGLARRARGFVVLAHPTGHLITGLGCVIKMLGMGLASRKGKLAMHSVAKPFIRRKACIGCGECALWCPVDAITLEKGKAQIDSSRCVGCGECLAMCRSAAVGFDWKVSSESLQRRIAEHALAVVHRREDRFIHVAIGLRITKDCDCMQDPGPVLFPDIGLLGSADPVAVDQAILDLIEEKSGKRLAEWSYPKIDPTIQLAHGEAIGLGSRTYRLIEVV